MVLIIRPLYPPSLNTCRHTVKDAYIYVPSVYRPSAVDWSRGLEIFMLLFLIFQRNKIQLKEFPGTMTNCSSFHVASYTETNACHTLLPKRKHCMTNPKWVCVRDFSLQFLMKNIHSKLYIVWFEQILHFGSCWILTGPHDMPCGLQNKESPAWLVQVDLFEVSHDRICGWSACLCTLWPGLQQVYS